MPISSNYVKFGPVFDAEATADLGRAFDKAIARLGEGTHPLVRDFVASQIINLAARGELDPDRLCHAALAELDRHTGARFRGRARLQRWARSMTFAQRPVLPEPPPSQGARLPLGALH